MRRVARPHRARAICRGVAVGALIAVVLAACGADPANGQLTSIGLGLSGPSGATATVYASGLPQVSALAFGPDGALWAATAAYDDSGHDGVFRVARAGSAPVEVLAHQHTVLGLLWYRGELYVSSHARVDAYSGFTGHGFARHRTVVTFPDSVGEGNGIALAPDGRISLGITSPCDSCSPKLSASAAVVSFAADGSGLRVDASHIRAPVGLAYYPGTSDLFVTMNQRDDLGAATPGDWLGVVHHGDDWRFPACYGQKGPACAGVPAPTAVLDAHAAVSGVALLPGSFGTVAGPSAMVAEWATGKVLRVALQKVGGHWTGSVSPFLTGIKQPVAVIRGPGNALLVGDWGTGRIYRITAGS